LAQAAWAKCSAPEIPAWVAALPFRQGYLWAFDVAPDGRILIAHAPGSDHISVLLNWPEEAKRIEAAGFAR